MNDSRAVLSKWIPKNHNNLFCWCLVTTASTFGALPGGLARTPLKIPPDSPSRKGKGEQLDS